jgi:hypothetical protein
MPNIKNNCTSAQLRLPYHKGYEQKINDFISSNEAVEVNDSITNNFQKDLRNTLNECNQLINTENNAKHINLNPNTPVLKGFIKVHKKDTPIRPVVNFKNSPAYNLAKMLSSTLNKYIPLPYA